MMKAFLMKQQKPFLMMTFQSWKQGIQILKNLWDWVKTKVQATQVRGDEMDEYGSGSDQDSGAMGQEGGG